MKNYTKIILTFVLCAAFAGCTPVEEQELPVTATVNIEKISGEQNNIGIRFTPAEDAASFSYAISIHEDISGFESGAMDGTTTVDGNQSVDVIFEDLESNVVYTVYARAFDESGRPGGTAVYRAMTGDAFYKVSLQYATDHCAGVVFDFTGNYYGTEYYLGKPEDKDAFLAGTLEVSAIGDEAVKSIVKNWYDLEPSTEYVVYAKGYNLAGLSEYRELHFTTTAENECPKVELEVVNSDVYKNEFRLTGNQYVGKIAAVVGNLGDYGGVISVTYGGDAVNMLEIWSEIEWMGAKSSVTGTLDISKTTPELTLGREFEIWVLVYDKDMNPAGIQLFETKAPEFNPEAKGGSVSIEITNITSTGATYVFDPEEDCFAFLYDTVEADWYDDLKENSSEWHVYYLHEIFFKNALYFCYTRDMEGEYCTFTEDKGQASFRYYAAACPMNVNGPREGGWLPVVLKDYTTLAE